MSKTAVQTTEDAELEQAQERISADRNLSSNRRYVGTKETIAYIVYDIAQSFNISKYDNIFITDIVQIGLRFQTIVTFINGIWDAVNDLFLAAIVDRTQTRWGKFRPWLMVLAGPGLLMSMFYWLMPIIFKGAGPYNMVKCVCYLLFKVISEVSGTIGGVAKSGMLASITPNVNDRTRLITQANLLSSFVENAPKLLMGFFIDILNNTGKSDKMTNLFVGAGLFCACVSSAMSIYFYLTAKERVLRREEKPSIMTGIKSVITNKPLLILTLVDFLDAFNIDFGTNYYYINVLGFASMSTVVGIPGAFVSPISYSYVQKLRSKFSTRSLWVFTSTLPDVLMLGVFGVGAVNNNFKRRAVMIPAFMIRETIWMSVYGIKKVIPEEMSNECIDYGEWKTGYRTEGMTGVARGLAKKLVGTLGGTLQAFILSKIGYQQGAGYGNQSAHTEFMLFAMCTIVPVATGFLANIPKFFYPIDAKTRDRMYTELAQRRSEIARQLDDTKKEQSAEPAAE